MRLLLFCVFLYLVGVIQAAPATNTTNTTISDSLKAPSFTTRTLWTIVSSCVLTLFACIYSAIHPNIRSPNDSLNDILLRRLGIMIMALITPELIVVWAMRQSLSARHVTEQFNASGYYPSVHPESEEKDSVEAPEQRGNRFVRFLVMLAKGVLYMLVFVWHFLSALARRVKRLIEAYFSKHSEDYTWTQTHSFFVLMGGFMLYVDGEPYLTLRPDYILKLIHDGCIDVPKLTAEQIHDKSKGNAVSKGLVMLQVAWFVIQLITRAIYHLEVTQLEVGTLAFAVLNFLTYAMWWHKPLDVQCPHPVYWKSTESRPEDLIDVPAIDVPAHYWIFSPLLQSIGELLSPTRLQVPRSLKFRVPTFDGRADLNNFDGRVLRLAGLLMATIFGAIHCMAWFFSFPTYQEQVLWRMSAIAITFTPWLILLVDNISNLVKGIVVWCLYVPIFYVSITLYITARAVLLVLMFTTLRNLPPDAYKVVSWTSEVPHL